MRYVLVTRAGCHLCDEAAEALHELGIEFEAIDVDTDPELLRLYDFRVPVVLGEGKVVVADGRLDRDRLGAIFHR